MCQDCPALSFIVNQGKCVILGNGMVKISFLISNVRDNENSLLVFNSLI